MKKHLNVNTVLIGLLIVVSLGVFGYQKFFKNSLSADNGIAEVYVGNQVVKRNIHNYTGLAHLHH